MLTTLMQQLTLALVLSLACPSVCLIKLSYSIINGNLLLTCTADFVPHSVAFFNRTSSIPVGGCYRTTGTCSSVLNYDIWNTTSMKNTILFIENASQSKHDGTWKCTTSNNSTATTNVQFTRPPTETTSPMCTTMATPQPSDRLITLHSTFINGNLLLACTVDYVPIYVSFKFVYNETLKTPVGGCGNTTCSSSLLNYDVWETKSNENIVLFIENATLSKHEGTWECSTSKDSIATTYVQFTRPPIETTSPMCTTMATPQPSDQVNGSKTYTTNLIPMLVISQFVIFLFQQTRIALLR